MPWATRPFASAVKAAMKYSRNTSAMDCEAAVTLMGKRATSGRVLFANNTHNLRGKIIKKFDGLFGNEIAYVEIGRWLKSAEFARIVKFK